MTGEMRECEGLCLTKKNISCPCHVYVTLWYLWYCLDFKFFNCCIIYLWKCNLKTEGHVYMKYICTFNAINSEKSVKTDSPEKILVCCEMYAPKKRKETFKYLLKGFVFSKSKLKVMLSQWKQAFCQEQSGE